MALFTGKGDDGTTKVLDSKERIPKSSELIEALGALDELNSFVGLARAKENTADNVLRDVQEALFIIQAEIAGAEKHVSDSKIANMEYAIAAIEKEMPPITAFTVPGETELSALFDVTRAIARRAERCVIALDNTGTRVLSRETRAYLNRLSSLLYALARYANHAAGVAEENPSYK